MKRVPDYQRAFERVRGDFARMLGTVTLALAANSVVSFFEKKYLLGSVEGVTAALALAGVVEILRGRAYPVPMRKAPVDKEVDCGQDGVCAIAPGCLRHFEERCFELAEEKRELSESCSSREARIESLEARIRELTEWRPMHKAPMGEWILLLDGGEGGGRVIGKTRLPWGQFFTQSGMSIFPIGWLPLPSTEGGES